MSNTLSSDLLRLVLNHNQSPGDEPLDSGDSPLSCTAETVDIVIKEGLAGLLFRYQKRGDATCQFSEPDRQRLEQVYYGGVQKNIRLLKALSEIVAQTRSRDLRVVLLQGISLLDTVYSDIGLRALTDMDLWVLPDDLPGINDSLCRLGYQPRSPYPQVFIRDDICIDVHTHLLWADRIKARNSILKLDQQEIFNSAQEQVTDGETVYRLNPADQFIYLSLHCLKHYAQRLIWLVDLVFLVRNWDHSDWVALHRRADELGQIRTIQYIFFLLQDLVDYQPSQDCGDLFLRTSLKTWEMGILEKRRIKGQLPVWAPLALMPVNLVFSQKVRFVYENLFPAPQVLRQIFSSGSSLKNWQLYGLRVLQLLGLKKPD